MQRVGIENMESSESIESDANTATANNIFHNLQYDIAIL